MKRFSPVSLFLFTLLAVSCLQDPVMPDSEPALPVVRIDKENVTRVSVTVTGSFTDKASSITEYGFQMAEGVPDEWKQIAKNPPRDGSGTFTYTVEGLLSEHVYYFRSYISNGSSVKYSPASEAVQTLPRTVASVTEVTLEGSVLSAVIADDGGRDILSVGFLYGPTSDVNELILHGIDIPAVLAADGKHFSARIDRTFALGETCSFIAYAENAEDALHTYKGYSPGALTVTANDAFPAQIKDPVFAEYLATHCDSNKDGVLSWEELRAVTSIDVITDKIATLEEIALMPDLERLSCRGSARKVGKLTALDISQNPRLTYLDCAQNQLTQLNLEANPALRTLDVGGNPLTALDMYPCESLQSFNARGCVSLKQIGVWAGFKEADHPGFTKESATAYVCSPYAPVPFTDAVFKEYCLANFDGDRNGTFTVSEAATVEAISLSTDETASLQGLAYFTGLRSLSCCGTSGRLTALDVSSNKLLAVLACAGNQLTELDVTNNPELTVLDCSRNQLTALNIRKNKKLEQLDLSGNPLAEIRLRFDQEPLVTPQKPEPAILLYQINGLSLKPVTLSLRAEETASLTVTIDADTVAFQESILARVEWASSDESVAIVSPAGEVLAIGYGQCTISATYDGNRATCTVNVAPIPVTGITLDPVSCELLVEETVQLFAILLPENATDKTVTWKSSQPEVATVSETGLVTAVSEGTCTITASTGKLEATCQITVYNTAPF